jgi:hypothetical protein
VIESAIESAIAWVIESATTKENMNETNEVAGTTYIADDRHSYRRTQSRTLCYKDKHEESRSD